MLQVVVGLFAQGVLGGQRQLGEALGETEREEGPGEQPGRQHREDVQGALTGQMFSLGVPSSCTMRSIWWISEVPGSSGLCASSSARMQPAALRSTGGASPVSPCSLQPPGPTRAAQLPPYHMSMLVLWVVMPSSSSGARYLRRGHLVALPAPARPAGRTRPGTSHSPQSHHFGGHGLGGHPVGACQAKIGCNRGAQSGGSPALSCGHSRTQPVLALTDLHTALVCHQQVGDLQVPVGNGAAGGEWPQGEATPLILWSPSHTDGHQTPAWSCS